MEQKNLALKTPETKMEGNPDMKKRALPIGVQTFEKIRDDGYLYVDKTEYIWKLVENGTIYFLSRPRRFGKSVLVSTLESYFSGRKDLFEGLWIEEKENDRGEDAWLTYPIISFYLSGGEYQTESGLANTLEFFLDETEKSYGIAPTDFDLPNRFRSLIRRLFEKTGRRVVILVDEYDKPLLATMLTNPEQEKKNRALYKSFFSVLKDEDRYLKFVFFTGVTKFTKVSIFSDLNHLLDISLSDEFSGICGISETELIHTFDEEIIAMANEQEMTREECLAELKRMYDGYHFSKNSIGVYNPFSLLYAFWMKDFGRYWFETGTPDILVRKMKDSSLSLEKITDGVEATEDQLKDYRIENKDPIPLFYQTGYLTICGYNKRFRRYSLRFPNEEVKYGFLNFLVPDILGYKDEENPLLLDNLILDLEAGDIESFMNRLFSIFASIPYPEGNGLSYEETWKYQIFLIMELMGAYVESEPHTSQGRADCVVRTADYIYIFEFKLDKDASEALAQIEEKGYADRYAADPRKLFKIGVSFSSEKRNIIAWEVR